MDPATGNALLDALHPGDREHLLENGRAQDIAPGREYAAPAEEIPETMFPTSGTLSLLVTTGQPESDETVESATVGREGMIGAMVPLGIREIGQDLIGQVPGRFIGIPTKSFEARWHESERLAELVNGYLAFLLSQTAISVACNALHHTTERMARWLLMTHDRVDTESFELKQEFLAAMLGVQRPTVSLAASTLQNAALISYSRGLITIVDREGLEGAACPCYERGRSEYARLVPLEG